ncbi:flagellar assembly protein FliW [bacterium]|jgi:flagellar assembly factor FliW|nr:flagellar assembly protein FliW [bacterium]
MNDTMSDASPRMTTIQSELFGPLAVADDAFVDFPTGIPGFPSCQRWVFITGAKQGTAWLQSVDRSGLAFLLVDPFLAFEGYSVELSDSDVRRLDAGQPNDVAVYAIVTLPGSAGEHATANLQGPLLLNHGRRRGMQLVLGDGPWGIRESFPVTKIA